MKLLWAFMTKMTRAPWWYGGHAAVSRFSPFSGLLSVIGFGPGSTGPQVNDQTCLSESNLNV